MKPATMLALVATSSIVSTSAFALAQRTFVATTGSDAAPCSLAAPCRSFDAALALTASGGEIIVLDSGGYGAVGISKDVSIIAPKGVYAGISVFPTSSNATGITVYNSKVILRGLSIHGQGGDTGIHVFGDAVAQIEDCAISNLALYGVRVGGALAGPHVFIHTTMIHDNGSHGIYATGAARVNVDRTSSQRNGGDGLLAANGATVTVTASVLSANSFNGATAYSDSSATALIIDDSTLSSNAGKGVYSLSQIPVNSSTLNSLFVHVARNTIASNMLEGVLADASDQTSYLAASDNHVFNNGNSFRQLNNARFYTYGNNTIRVNKGTRVGTFIYDALF